MNDLKFKGEKKVIGRGHGKWGGAGVEFENYRIKIIIRANISVSYEACSATALSESDIRSEEAMGAGGGGGKFWKSIEKYVIYICVLCMSISWSKVTVSANPVLAILVNCLSDQCTGERGRGKSIKLTRESRHLCEFLDR